MTTAKTVWPRPYILQAYEVALSEGCARIENIGGKTRAKSFIASFYRIRRKADVDMQANYIRPEFDLVSANYEEERDSVLLVYNSLPDNIDLPKIVSVDRSEIAPKPSVKAPAPTLDSLDADTDMDVAGTIEHLLAEAMKKA